MTRGWLLRIGLALAAWGMLGCHQFYEIQMDSRAQILRSEASQVKVRAAQSRSYETRDRQAMMGAVVDVFQDLGFYIEVLDEELGIISGKKFAAEPEGSNEDVSYLQYDTESLVAFTRSYRTWGPFYHRRDLIRLTVTVRVRDEANLIVRASAQHALRPVEHPGPYQHFFRALEQSLFAARTLAEPAS